MSAHGYAVIDIETTGFSPKTGDRVVELAVVHLDHDGEVTGRWETLLNPDRDLGPQHIHGIQARDVLKAPRFHEITPQLVQLLSDRVLVAHNASFDSRFLLAELSRAGYTPQPDLQLSALCTMQLARQFLPGSRRSLADCCSAYDIEIGNAHRASADAFATAQLLRAYMRSGADNELWTAATATAATWPPHPIGSTGVPTWIAREYALTRNEEPPFLERITDRLSEASGPAAHIDYLALLDRCVIDRHISVHEAEALVELAGDLGVSRDEASQLHKLYFDDLVAAAWDDGVVTHDEVTDLTAVAGLLSLPVSVVSAALDGPRRAPRHVAAPGAPSTVAFSLEPGDIIVLTGDMTRARSDIELDLISRGYATGSGVTKKTKLLVAADPDSLSGKAKKARDYGIPVIGEQGLEKLLRGL